MKDLVLEAVKAFPVWPDGATHIIFNVEQNEFAKANLGSESATVKSKRWQIACTREQHIRKRIELFEGAPEEATHYSQLGDHISKYHKLIGGERCYFGDFCKNWMLYRNRLQLEADNDLRYAIPRPTPEELAYLAEIDSKNKGVGDVTDTDVGEWRPEVGQECECSKGGDNWYICKVLMYGNHTVFLKSHKADKNNLKEYSVPLTDICFRPLKTEAEKERERLENDLRNLVKDLNEYQIELISDYIQGRKND